MIRNLTPHPITLRTPSAGDVTIPPDGGIVPRVSTTPGDIVDTSGLPVPVIGAPTRGAVEGLPEPETGVWLLVSGMVAAACGERPDVLAPGTAPADDPIRDEQGRIVAVTRLVAAASAGSVAAWAAVGFTREALGLLAQPWDDGSGAQILDDSHVHPATAGTVAAAAVLDAVRDGYARAVRETGEVRIVTRSVTELGARTGTILPGGLPCHLRGPLVGDPPIPESAVRYAPRPPREYPSRMLLDGRPTTTDQVTLILGPGDEPRSCVVYTCYAGPLAPREPTDPALADDLRAESEAFWRDHALVAEQ